MGWFDDFTDTEDLGRALVRNHEIAWFELTQRPDFVGLLADRWSVVVVGVAVLLLESRAKRLLGLKVTKVAHLVPSHADVSLAETVVPILSVLARRDLDDAPLIARVSPVVEEPFDFRRRPSLEFGPTAHGLE